MEKVAILLEFFPTKGTTTGGYETRYYYLLKYLRDKFDITLITSKQKEGRELEGVKIKRVFEIPYSNKGYLLDRFKLAYKMYKEAVKDKYDIIEGGNFLSYLPANFAARKLNCKKIATYHEVWIGNWINYKGLKTGIFGEIWERINLRLNWDKIISVSNFTKKKLIEQGIIPEKIEVIPNGINLEEFKKIKAKKFDRPTIIYIGRLVDYKRVDILIKATHLIKKEIKDIQCLIIGQGDERKNLEKLVKSLDLQNNIKFLGYVPSFEETIKLRKSSHIFVTPSTLEGFGISILEAMASKIPYICSDLEVFKEITENGKGGLFFKKNNFNNLAKKILLLLKDKELYKKKIIEAQNYVKKYDWKEIAKKVEKIWYKL